MLPLPDLDDRIFKQIVEESRKMIPKLLPQWTDENYHDPGITLIELFAWLTEMQQYYLNRITLKNELKFLKLLGIRLKEASLARTDVTFEGLARVTLLPRGTRLAATDQSFETEEPILLIPAKIEKVIVFAGSDTYDYTPQNMYKGISYFAFGREAKVGSRLYIGFDQELPLNKNICLNFNTYEDYPVGKGCTEGLEAALIPSAKVFWRYFGTNQGLREMPGWIPLHVIKDETVHLSRSGRFEFRIPVPMKSAKIHPANEMGRYWLCCTVEEEGYELPPKIETILLNTVSVVQQKTLSEFVSFSSNGESGQVFEAGGYLQIYGCNKVQVQDGEGNWRYWKEVGDLSLAGPDDAAYILIKDEEKKKAVIVFSDGKLGKIPPKGIDNIRLISYLPSYAGEMLLGRSTGLPNQIYRVHQSPIIQNGFMVQVGKKLSGTKEYIYQDWKRVDDFDTSGSYDRHFILKMETGEILFGNNEKGLVPEALEDDNICVISCRVGGGERGNVRENEVKTIIDQAEELQGVTVSNRFSATNGSEKETIDDAKHRLRRVLKKQFRAITCSDFEEIALTTPGLRVARVKAIPLFTPDIKDYPVNKAPAQMTVVVVPYSESKKPVPSMGFLKTIHMHLNKYRMVTTEINVISPEYIKVIVNAFVVVSPHIKFDSKRINESLDQLLCPLDNQDGVRGWPFGRTVYKGDIYRAINKIEGVEYIKELWLDAEGMGIRKDSGDIHIPPHGLVYSGEHQIEFVSRLDL